MAIDSDLLNRFDAFIANQGYTDRSEASRDLIRDRLANASVDNPRAPVVSTVTPSRQVQKLADLLIGTKGVQHGRLVMSSPNVGSPATA